MAWMNWNRQYRFAAGPSGGMGFEIGITSDVSPEALHINFKIDKADTETPNTASISLWNLSPEHLAILREKDCVVTLRAGYEQHMSQIFVGVVTYEETDTGESSDADRETKLEAVDGRIQLRDTFLSKSYAGPINSKQIIDDIAGEMGIPVEYSYNVKHYDFPNGYAIVGPGRTGLDKACASSALQWQIQDGILKVKNKRDTMTREVFLLNSSSGLVGIPKKITYGEDAEGSQEQPGWEVVYFLNGAIGIGDYIRLESKLVQGYFRVKTVSIEGDNLEGDWLCTAKLIAV